MIVLAMLASLLSIAEAATPDFDVILYGATGCVGGFAARHLAEQPGLRWAVAGRNGEKLESFAQELCEGSATASCPEVIVATLDDSERITRWLQRTRVVATAAGPYSVHDGERLLEASAKLGVHYVDVSDEFYWQRDMADRYHAQAQKSGAHVVFSGGFCVLAGDLGAQLALEEFTSLSSDVVSLDEWLETYNGGSSAGVANTLKVNATYPKEWDSDPYVLAPEVEPELRVDKSVTGISGPQLDLAEGSVTDSIFGPFDARLLRRSFSLLGQAVHLRSGATTNMYVKWAQFLALHPGSRDSLHDCPTQELYDDGAWKLRLVAKRGRRSRSVVLSGDKDPGFHFTSVGLAEVALCLAGVTSNCTRPGSTGGVLTPMAALAVEPLQHRLESIGLLRVSSSHRVSDAGAWASRGLATVVLGAVAVFAGALLGTYALTTRRRQRSQESVSENLGVSLQAAGDA